MECSICSNTQVSVTQFEDENHYDVTHHNINCTFCGEFNIHTFNPSLIKKELHENALNKLSFITRSNSEHGTPITLTLQNLKSVIREFEVPKDLMTRINKLVLYTYRRVNKPSDCISINVNLAPIVYSNSYDELMYYLGVAKELDLISYPYSGEFRLSIKGWEYVNKLLENQQNSNQAFIAMSFSKDKKEIWQKGIKPALKSLGYNAVRIDEKEHNDMIIDHIIAEIKKSGIIIADFTEHKHGVYFEAGYAMGLGIPVIWTCHEDDISGIHFDTKPFNHIGWKTPEELGKKLKIRIEATIPNRPKPRSEDSSLRSE